MGWLFNRLVVSGHESRSAGDTDSEVDDGSETVEWVDLSDAESETEPVSVGDKTGGKTGGKTDPQPVAVTGNNDSLATGDADSESDTPPEADVVDQSTETATLDTELLLTNLPDSRRESRPLGRA